MKKEFDIEKILNEKIDNVIVIELNKPNMDLFAKSFYDLFIKP
jgi:hypothetical protein